VAPANRPAKEVSTRETITEGPAQQGPTPMGSGAILVTDKPAQVEVIAVDASPGDEGICANEAEPQPEDMTDGDASTPLPMGPILGFSGERPWLKPTGGRCPG
jgi:hypothetical protein